MTAKGCPRTTPRHCGGSAWPPTKGEALAQYSVGVMYANGRGVSQDDIEAARWYRMAAEQGYAQAQASLGAMYV
jgi:TPR repeat protein